MSRRELIDADVRGPLDEMLKVFPGGVNAIADIVERRAAVDGVMGALKVPEHPDIAVEDRVVRGDPDVAVRVYTPLRATGPMPGIYYIHGGGMIFGTAAGDDDLYALTLSERLGAVVVSVDYRLAPENPYPAQLVDSYAGLTWMSEHAEELGVDPDRLAIYGASAGGNLTIALALLARDMGGPALRYIMPIYPMIDDTDTTPSTHETPDLGIWDRGANIEAWAWYLGGEPADQYAAPTRATDLTGLPPAFIDAGMLDIFRDETVDFAQRLMRAGVPTELRVWPGAYHGAALERALDPRS